MEVALRRTVCRTFAWYGALRKCTSLRYSQVACKARARGTRHEQLSLLAICFANHNAQVRRPSTSASCTSILSQQVCTRMKLGLPCPRNSCPGRWWCPLPVRECGQRWSVRVQFRCLARVNIETPHRACRGFSALTTGRKYLFHYRCLCMRATRGRQEEHKLNLTTPIP